MIIRVIASFLFAIVILVFGHFGAWWLAAKHAQEKIITSLNGIDGVTVTPGTMKPLGYPRNVTLEVGGMTLKWQTPNAERAIELHANKLWVETPLFDMRKAQVTLDKELFIKIYDNGNVLRSFRAVIEGGRFSSFWRPDETTEYAFNFNNLTLWDAENSHDAALRANTGYIVRETPGIRTPVSWRISLKDIRAEKALIGEPFTLNRLVAGVGFENDFFSQYGPEMLPLIAQNKADRIKARQSIAQKIQKTSTPSLTIESLQVENSENWVSLRGGFGLNAQRYLDGKISINTNDLNPVLRFLGAIHLLDENVLRNSREISRVIKSGNNPSNIGISFERDRAYVNSSQLSTVQTLPEIIMPKKK